MKIKLKFVNPRSPPGLFFEKVDHQHLLLLIKPVLSLSFVFYAGFINKNELSI
jgi:hypothetical protein